MDPYATHEALGRVDERSKEGIKALDHRLKLMEGRMVEVSKARSEDMRELRTKFDQQERRIEHFTEQQGVLMKTTRENEGRLDRLAVAVGALKEGIQPVATTAMEIKQVFTEVNLVEMKNNQNRLEGCVDDLADRHAEDQGKIDAKLTQIFWVIIGGLGTVVLALIGILLTNYLGG